MVRDKEPKRVPAILHVSEGPDSGRLFTLVGDQVTIGRNAENTIVLNDTAISGVHTKITRDEHGRFTVQDQASTNGTFLNGKEQRTSDLRHGDELRIGSTAMIFEVREESRRIRGGNQDEGVVAATHDERPRLILPSPDLSTIGREELERSHRRSLLLEQLDQVLAETDGPSEVLTAVLDAALAGAGAVRGAVLLVDRDSGEMVPSVVRDLAGETEGEVHFSKSLAFEVVAGREPFCGDSPLAEDGPRQVICAPIPTTSNKGGVLYLEGPAGLVFGDGARRVVAAIGRRAGASISASRWRADFELLFSSTIDAIMNTIQAKDVYTRGHSERVRHYSKLLAKELGIKGDELYRITLGAGLHDIGKVGMPDSVLKHNEKPILTPEQMVEVKKHPARGARILKDIPFLKDVVPAAELHHEDWDGTGYPHGLAGEDIPLIARIVAVADTYDAITTDRPYQKGKSFEEGLAVLHQLKGKRLEPRLVELFDKAWHRYRKVPTPGTKDVSEVRDVDVDAALNQIIQIG